MNCQETTIYLLSTVYLFQLFIYINCSPWNLSSGVMNNLFITYFAVEPIMFYLFYEVYMYINNGEVCTMEIYDPLRLIPALVIEDMLYYSVHRAFHNTRLYRHHKLHHSYAYVEPFMALYGSILENICLNFLTVGFTAIVTGMNIYLLCIWVTAASMYGLVSHMDTSTHSLHHLLPDKNFGVTGLTDFMCGTRVKSERFMKKPC